ncbi:hypothetical protein [Leptospira meyeri]|uniref:hypothetical protein n=1 Tax=Leptospira meyeri TaxID=29508 RepID=UPI000C295B4F|nr:hypothetical protein [Leptospira meyeri]PKA25313.1 hypothetical protein CH381_16290 [Leptospira sp. mixed culture ATI2-C-A1]MCW7489442.1 hypothetical protein [Leptospira meyeri]PKA11192.1 hypothetical protein CH372_15570 [Leptospira meyeri]TGM23780.1 hypothetical protein EHQ73_01700 [Leptospira meyeri]TGM66520.1 hypothetical protein EHQ93_00410 [Leptospira meyeri]
MKYFKFLLFVFLFINCNNLGKSGIGEETILGRDIFDELNVYIGIFAQDVANDRVNYSRRLTDIAILSRWYDAMGVSYQKRDLSFNRKKAKSCITLTSSYLLATRDATGTLLLTAGCKLDPVAPYPLP